MCTSMKKANTSAHTTHQLRCTVSIITITDHRSTLDEPCWPKTPYTGTLKLVWLLFLFCFDVFNFVLSRRASEPHPTVYLFDARHVDMQHTTGSSDMSNVVCRMSMSRTCRRSRRTVLLCYCSLSVDCTQKVYGFAGTVYGCSIAHTKYTANK
jgi:hypothetical protein